MAQTRMISNPLLPIASYSLSLVYTGVAGLSANNFIDTDIMNTPALLLNGGNMALAGGMAVALVTATLTDSGYNSFNNFFKDCKTGLTNMASSLAEAFETADNKPTTRNSNTATRLSYQRPATRSAYHSSTSSGWETWAPKTILAASSIVLAATFATGLGKTVLEYGCEVGTANENACNLFGLEYNERPQNSRWLRP